MTPNRDALITTLSAPSTVDLCAEQLRARILDGQLTVGSRMPPERELATRFGVNRVTVRSALARLTLEGLLSVRQGRGYEVQDFQREAGPTLLPSVLSVARERSRDELAGWVTDMLAARRHLARAVLLELVERHGHAAERADESATSLGAVLDALAAFERAVDAGTSDAATLAALDMAIVRALLDAAGNRVLRLAFNPVLDTLAALPELAAQLYAAPRSNVQAYGLLRAWLAAPDARGIEPLLAALAARDRHNVSRLMETPHPPPESRA
ncbi:MAG: GntR family transcriptional regulator [Polyangiales bacterium]|nr:FadR family transcriptional regulator [Sandaracinaceae bacterium]